MGQNNIKDFKGFRRVNEREEDEKPFRLYGEGSTPEAQLINYLKRLVEDIKKANPTDQAHYDSIKSDIRSKTSAIKRHRSYADLKYGIPWQDGFIKLSDWSTELKSAVTTLATKASKKGLQ